MCHFCGGRQLLVVGEGLNAAAGRFSATAHDSQKVCQKVLTDRPEKFSFPAALDGVVAQLVEHHNGIVGVAGSIPVGSTILQAFLGRLFPQAPRPDFMILVQNCLQHRPDVIRALINGAR